MRFLDLLPLAARAVTLNKGRAGLTMLGMIVGIASVVLMLAVGQAAQRYLISQIASFGSDVVFVANGKGDETRGGPPSLTLKQTLTHTDVKKIKALSWPQAVSGVVITSDLVSSVGENKLARVVGSSPDEIRVFSMRMERGRFLEDRDVNSRRRVIVLGSGIAKRLFGQESAIGQVVKLGRQPFHVIGVLAHAGTRLFSEVDDHVYIPFTAFFDLYKKNRLNFITVKTGTVAPRAAKEFIRVAVRETHGIDNPNNNLAKDDFRVASQEDAVRNATIIGTVLQILLGSIASISLIVAGVGIMNIMYVSVTERTREIGLRKAVGATAGDVLGQFFYEAILLASIAGICGAALGITLSWIGIQLISHFQSGWTFRIPWNGALIGCAVSTVIGVVFGFFPARRAARLYPIDALRHE